MMQNLHKTNKTNTAYSEKLKAHVTVFTTKKQRVWIPIGHDIIKLTRQKNPTEKHYIAVLYRSKSDWKKIGTKAPKGTNIKTALQAAVEYFENQT